MLPPIDYASRYSLLVLRTRRTLALFLLHEASEAGGDPHVVARAAREIDEAEICIQQGELDIAMRFYDCAWENARQALQAVSTVISG